MQNMVDISIVNGLFSGISMEYVNQLYIWLVVWNMFYFSIQLGIIIPTDFNSIIFQRGRSTTNQMRSQLFGAVWLDLIPLPWLPLPWSHWRSAKLEMAELVVGETPSWEVDHETSDRSWLWEARWIVEEKDRLGVVPWKPCSMAPMLWWLDRLRFENGPGVQIFGWRPSVFGIWLGLWTRGIRIIRWEVQMVQGIPQTPCLLGSS